MTNPNPSLELRALSDAATKGPWKVFNLLHKAYEVCTADNYATGGVCAPHRREDADFIVAAVNFTRAALSQTLPAPGEVGRLRQALRNIAEGNLGDQPWQANYARIKEVAAEALAVQFTKSQEASNG